MKVPYERQRSSRAALCVMTAAALSLSVSVAAVARIPEVRLPQGAAVPPTDDELDRIGELAVMKVCTECHPFEEIIVARRTPLDWSSVVGEMVKKGATGTPEQLAVVRGYLTRFYGVALVNSASAADLGAVLGLPSAQSDAIVAYRAGHGRFPNLPALLNVPGIDKEKIEADPAALKFD